MNKKVLIFVAALFASASIICLAIISIILFIDWDESESESNEVVLQTDVNGCFEFEKYDEETDECYVECETDLECEELEQKYSDIFDEYYDEDEWKEFFSEYELDQREEGEYEEDEVIASFEIEDGKILPNQVLENEYELVWNEFKKLFGGDKLFSKVQKLTLFSDGEDGVLAYVGELDSNYSTWELAVDTQDYTENGKLKNEKDLTATLIHEYAHIMTLNDTQLNNLQDCTTYNPGEGCLNGSAYLNMFYLKFWKGNVENDYKSLTNSCDLESEECEELQKFYEKYKDNFVSDYAATNPAEDIAESFANYIILSSFDNEPKVVREKLEFFEDFEELRKLKFEIRKSIVRERVRIVE